MESLLSGYGCGEGGEGGGGGGGGGGPCWGVIGGGPVMGIRTQKSNE